MIRKALKHKTKEGVWGEMDFEFMYINESSSPELYLNNFSPNIDIWPQVSDYDIVEVEIMEVGKDVDIHKFDWIDNKSEYSPEDLENMVKLMRNAPMHVVAPIESFSEQELIDELRRRGSDSMPFNYQDMEQDMSAKRADPFYSEFKETVPNVDELIKMSEQSGRNIEITPNNKRWTPVTESLPGIGKLVEVKHGLGVIAKNVCIGKNYEGLYSWLLGNDPMKTYYLDENDSWRYIKEDEEWKR